MTMSRNVLAAGAAGLALLALGACGSDDTPAATRPAQNDDAAFKKACEDLGGTVENGVCTNLPEDTPGELRGAVDEAAKANAAKAMADGLLKSANEAGWDAHDVGGSSETARQNVMTVLKARADIMAELDKAKAAVDEIGKLHEQASAGDKERIADILAQARANHDAIKAILDAEGGGSLMAKEDSVKAGQPVGDSDEEIAQARADEVAMAMETALHASDSAPRSVSLAEDAGGFKTSEPEDFTPERAGMSGMTFEQIFGGESVDLDKTEGLKADDGNAFTSFTATSRAEVQPARYKGIDGHLYCLAAKCAVSGGEITGEVVFLPSDPDEHWFRENNGGDYTKVTDAAEYGYWLTESDMIGLHAVTLSTGTGNVPTFGVLTTANAPTEATYEGGAEGYSYRETGTGDDMKRYSGEFTADVRLKAKFGSSNAMLTGSISGFKGGAHVNERWHVALGAAAAASQTISGNVTQGTRDDDATAGTWTARAYGEGGKNPSGIVGSFSAGFEDGNAAGVYHAD